MTRIRPTTRKQPAPGKLAREYAELWYIAIRDWHLKTDSGFVVTGSGPPRSQTNRMQVVGIGSYGGPPSAGLYMPLISTPLGWLSEQAVGVAITALDLPELTRLRNERSTCAVSLLRDGGWSSNREGAMLYGVAVLTLAVRLGDTQAEVHLQVVKRQLSECQI